MTFLILLAITIVCLFLALKKKKTFFLVIPFISIFFYFLVQIILVPMPFIDTIKFIFSLK
ncbi:hypothetical protein ACFYKX_14580 [Cytobacillus sp. FJAT-54145]|uniref:Tripartite tricarboxylate transporter TctB family protein n=1 Tax=Cytobacillus spartinae TaxID=3299023 RepID=A0ABW6KG14_9BACI